MEVIFKSICVIGKSSIHLLFETTQVDILARDSFKNSCHLRNDRDELYCVWCKRRGRRGGLLVSALDSGSSGPGSSPGWGHCVVFGQDTTQCLTVPLSTQVYKWVPGNLMLGGTL